MSVLDPGPAGKKQKAVPESPKRPLNQVSVKRGDPHFLMHAKLMAALVDDIRAPEIRAAGLMHLLR
jgi:hypothetical protein